MGSTEQVIGWDFRITLLSSSSETGQKDSKTEDEHKSEHTTGEEGLLVKVGAYMGYFASEIITENIGKLAGRVGSRKRT